MTSEGAELAVDEGALERQVDEAGGDAVFPERNLPQQQRGARGRLDQRQRLAHRAAGQIDLVQEQKSRDAHLLELAQDDLQSRGLARIGFADHHRGVADRQHPAHVVHELDRSGAIDERHPVAHVIDVRDVRLDAHRVGARFGAGIADAGALAHRALPRRAAAACEQALEQAGLAALERADDRYQSRPGYALFGCGARCGHRSLPWSWRFVAPVRRSAPPRGPETDL